MRSRKLSKMLVGIGVVLAVCLALSFTSVCKTAEAAKPKVIKIRYSAAHPARAALWVRATKWLAEEFKRRVEARTEYKIQNQFLFGGAIAGVGENLEAAQGGSTHVAMVCSAFEQSKMQLQNYAWWPPFSSGDSAQCMRASDRTVAQFPILTDMFEKRYNLKVVARLSNECYQVITNFPVKTLDDLKGHKIAHGGSMVPWIDALGSVGVQTNLPEAYTSIDTGVYDGFFLATDMIYGFRLYEVAPYYTKVDLGAQEANWVFMNLDFWNNLPSELQKIYLEVGEDAKWWCCKTGKAQTASLLEKMRAAGMHYSVLSKKERARWAKVLSDAGVCDVQAKRADANGLPGSDVIKAYINNLEKEGYEWPWRPAIK